MTPEKPGSTRTRPGLVAAGLIPLLLVSGAAPLRAGSFVMTISDTAGIRDTHLRQDDANNTFGNRQELRLRTESGKARHALVQVTPGPLTNKTILQAWLRLTQFGSSAPTPLDARVYPVTEPWSEPAATWNKRLSGTEWNRAGGTRGAHWTGRALVSDATNAGRIAWQVGPILRDWQSGDLPNNGLLIEPVAQGPGREVVFRSREYASEPAKRPDLLVYYTDEPPAVYTGWAEIQPRDVAVGSIDAPLFLWVDADAERRAPSGMPTGFDAVTLVHGGALAITAVDGVSFPGTMGGVAPLGWHDNGTTFTVYLPKIKIRARMLIRIRANVLAAATTNPLELPVFVDDISTPGAWAQVLWPANVDGIAGNGDSWNLNVLAGRAGRIDLVPDSIVVLSTRCVPLAVFGVDSLLARFPLLPDSIVVVPKERGWVDPAGSLCGAVPGAGSVVAHYGTLRDTSRLTVTPPLLTQVSAVRLRDAAEAETRRLVPRDTMFLDVELSDGDGLKDVVGLDFEIRRAGHESDRGAPAFRSAFRWRRAQVPAWTLLDPLDSSWSLVPGSCRLDTVTNSTATQVARLAFVPGAIARATDDGSWTVSVQTISLTPADTGRAALAGLDVAPYVRVTTPDRRGDFTPGEAGTTRLPLGTPASGRLTLEIEANAPYALQAAVEDLVGLEAPSETLFVGPPEEPIAWATNPAGTEGGVLSRSFDDLGGTLEPPSAEGPARADLYLWTDLSPRLTPQKYAGDLKLRILEKLGQTASEVTKVPLTASVAGNGLAAQSALAEVLPHAVQAGAAAKPFTAYLLPSFRMVDTGIDRILINLPPGYGAPKVTAVRVAGLPAAFSDRSLPGSAQALLASALRANLLVEVQFRADVPTAADPIGSGFVVQFDDSRTEIEPQTATEGDANGVDDGDGWQVTVLPGPLVRLVVSPETAHVFVDSTAAFTAAAFDAFGNPLEPIVTWTTEGDVGRIDPGTGVFTGTRMGVGSVVARVGAVADTASVLVRPFRGIAVRSVSGPSSVYQGQDGVGLRVRVENVGVTPALLDSLAPVFTRTAPGDADPSFTVRREFELPVPLAPGAGVSLDFTATVSTQAPTGLVRVGARAAARDTSGFTLTAAVADTALLLTLAPGGIALSGTQSGGTARPGFDAGAIFSLRVENQYPEARTLRELTFTNTTQGPGDRDQLDAELGDLTLYLDDGDGALDGGRDVALMQTVALGGLVRFAPLDARVPAGGSIRLFVGARIPAEARDGDQLDLAIQSADHVRFDAPVILRNPMPVAPAGSFRIDGMTSFQIALSPVGTRSFLAGSRNQVVLDARLPANGYQEDQLDRMAVANLGTAAAGSDIERVRLWVDDGDGRFDAALDRPIASLVFTGGRRFEATGLTERVPTAGLRVFVTADLGALAVDGRTLRFGFPTLPDLGVGMASGNDGPTDRAVENPFAQTISTVDRVTLAAVPIAAAPIPPGRRGIPLQHLHVTNSYSTPRTLSAIVFRNTTVGPGTSSQIDREIETVRLRADGDGDGTLGDVATDPVIGTAIFSGRQAEFTGLQWVIPAGASRHLFLAADVSLTAARDGDTLSAEVARALDVTFAEPTALAAAFPLDSRARYPVDGLAAAQLTRFAVPAITVGPGDGPVLALDLIVPPNGYADDALNLFRVVNLGDAGVRDIAELRLWRDGGDGAFTGAGDDRDLGPLAWAGGHWESAALAEPLAGAGGRLFVSLTVSGSPAESTTVRLAVPLGGVQNASGNDGPLDAAVGGLEGLLISSRPLLATLEIAPGASTVGQTVRVRMSVRNVGGEEIRNIVPSEPEPAGAASLVRTGGPTPDSLALEPGAAGVFEWTYVSSGPGDARVSGAASGVGTASGLVRRSLAASSNLHNVFTSVSRLDLFAVQSMPRSVNRGQPDVVPFSLTFANEGGASASDARLRALRIRLEDEGGAGIVPAELLSRVVVNEGNNDYLVKTVLESSGAEVDLTLASPVPVRNVDPVTLSLRLDLSPATAAANFRVVIADASWLVAEDATSGAPVVVDPQNGAYPLRSGLARIVSQARELSVQAVPAGVVRVAPGQAGAPLLTVRLDNPGQAGVSSEVRVSAFDVILADTLGVPLAEPSAVLSRLVVRSPVQTLAVQPIRPGDGAVLGLSLNPPLAVPVDAPLQLSITGDIPAGAPTGAFRLSLRGARHFDATDANTGDSVAVAFAAEPLPGPPVRVEAAAETLLARGAPLLPAVLLIGEPNVAAVRATLRHPGGPETARIRLDALTVHLQDQLARPLTPASYLGRLRVLWNAVEVANVSDPPASGSSLTAPLPGILIEPGDSAEVVITVDVSPVAPASFLELRIPASGVLAADANTGRPVAVHARDPLDLPMTSGLGRLAPPARDLAVALTSRMPATWAADGTPVVAGVVTLTNGASAGSGSIFLDRLTVAGADRAFAPVPLGAAAARVTAHVDGAPWAESADLGPDSLLARLVGDTLEVAPGAPVRIELRIVPRAASALASFRAGLEAAGIGVIQPASALLAVRVLPDGGGAFPLWTEAASPTPTRLRDSYSNFPNPFAAGRQATSIVYYLPADARVTLRVWTSRGEEVATLLADAPRPAGLHQSDRWNGRNGRGQVVTNGVYVAELVVRFADGTGDRILRKMAVVR